MDTIGMLAPYSCPDCEGPLWRMKGEGPPRFRCHVGHGYTAESLQAGQVTSREHSLWQVLRNMEERAALVGEMVEQATSQQHSEDAAHWGDVLTGLHGDMRIIQGMLLREPNPSAAAVKNLHSGSQ